MSGLRSSGLSRAVVQAMIDAGGGGGSSIYMPSSIVTILASGTSGQFARCNYAPSVIMLAAPADFGADQASVATLSTWTQANTANRTSLTVTGGALALVANGNYGNGPPSSYAIYRAVEPGPIYQRVCRLTCPTNLAGTGLWNDLASDHAQWASWYLWGTTGVLDAYVAGANVGTVTLTVGAPVWLRITLAAGYASMEYNTSASSTEPTTGWVLLGRAAVWAVNLPLYDVTWAQNHTTSAGGSAVTIAGLRESYGPPYAAPALSADGFAAAPAALTLAEIDAGSAWLPSQSALRLRLADVINRLPGDAGTWTFSMTGSASASPAAATTYQAAGSLTLKDAGTDTTTTAAYRYWTLRAKCVSTGGLQPASIDISGLVVT